MGTIKLRRVSRIVDIFRSYKIYLDDEYVGKVRHKGEAVIDVPEGTHSFMLKIDWCASNVVTFDMGKEELLFECGSYYDGWRIFKASSFIKNPTGDYLWLKLL